MKYFVNILRIVGLMLVSIILIKVIFPFIIGYFMQSPESGITISLLEWVLALLGFLMNATYFALICVGLVRIDSINIFTSLITTVILVCSLTWTILNPWIGLGVSYYILIFSNSFGLIYNTIHVIKRLK